MYNRRKFLDLSTRKIGRLGCFLTAPTFDLNSFTMLNDTDGRMAG